MPKLFGVDIAAEIAKGLGPSLLACKLRKTPIQRDSEDPTSAGNAGGDNPGPYVYDCRGMLQDGAIRQKDGTIVLGTSALILGGTLPANIVPLPGDELLVEGKWFKLLDAQSRDPAAASYLFTVQR